MKEGSVLAHVTDWNDDADEESAPKDAQKNTPKGLSPKESHNLGRFLWAGRVLVTDVLGAKWEPCIPFRLGKF